MVCRKNRADAHYDYALIAASQVAQPVHGCATTSKSLPVVITTNMAARKANAARPISRTAGSHKAAHTKSDATYGMPRVRAELLEAGVGPAAKSWVGRLG